MKKNYFPISAFSIIALTFSFFGCEGVKEDEPLMFGHIQNIIVEKKTSIFESEGKSKYEINFIFNFADKERSFRIIYPFPSKEYETPELIKIVLKNALSYGYFPESFGKGIPGELPKISTKGLKKVLGKKFYVHAYNDNIDFSSGGIFIVVYSKNVYFLQNMVRLGEGTKLKPYKTKEPIRKQTSDKEEIF